MPDTAPVMTAPLGDYIGGRFLPPTGEPLVSRDPVDESPVLETAWDAARVGAACDAAAEALPAWRALGLERRHDALRHFREAIRERTDDIADAIVREVGKLRSEAKAEVRSLVGRFDLVAARIREDFVDGPLRDHAHEVLRHHALGVVGVIGPFNFPLHLCHAHVVPALLLGNTVVMKPSEVAPLSGQRYAEAALAAGLPPGVLNVVQGGGPAGAALLAAPRLRGLAFTGSWPTGRRILEACLDRPEILVALEMGGKNACVVLDDADIRQAAHEIMVGGYLTTGQRCTCTDRVLVHQSVKEKLLEALVALVASLRFGRPDDPDAFAGPLATTAGADKVRRAIEAATRAGARELARGRAPEGGAFVPPTLHVLPDGVHDAPGYCDVEIFGPDVGVETFSSDDEAIGAVLAATTGLAHSVFTASRERFDRFFDAGGVGILNWNRSTNQASPRLPFGGVGTAGNYRPAGAYAHRNLAVPVAIQTNLPGSVALHDMLAPNLVAPDLDALAARHGSEEDEEARRTLVDSPRPLHIVRPSGGRLPESERWLERLYAGGRVVREKKPGVFDHLRSSGTWFVSVDDPPLSVLDGMTQTSTLCAGFAEAMVVRRYVEGGFGDTILSADDTALGGVRAAEKFAHELRELVPGLPFVSFVNSGAEANEKALALCKQRARSERQRRVLAFEGAFHGRTLLALHATYNPKKRGPFEFEGHEVTFAPFPVFWEPQRPEPAAPQDYLGTIARGRLDEALTRWSATGDGLLADELRSLAFVHERLSDGEYYAVIIEPMQSEGGDRRASARFFRALRLLTRHHGMPLVMDEVQTGFGLGGTFAWHERFNLVARDGNPDSPDCVTFAKRAQVGVVMSRFEDPEPTSSHAASCVRGLVHAEMMTEDPKAAVVEERVQKRLVRLARRFPDLVQTPRATGYAFAFDLPTPEHLSAYLGQRFWRGAIVFGAGTRTVRYRLSSAFGIAEINLLFDAIRRSLSWLDAHPGKSPPPWEDLPRPEIAQHERPEERERPEIRVRRIAADEHERVLADVMLMEERVYEPARRDHPETLRLAFDDPDGIALVAELRDGDEWTLVATALGAPLERFREVGGPDRDPFQGMDNTLYSIALTVDPGFRGFGLGRKLKEALLEEARAMRRTDGMPRYRHVAARNRLGKTDAMMRVNRLLGGYELYRLTGVYDDPEAVAVYYRMPVGPYVPETRSRGDADVPWQVDLADGLSRPFEKPPTSLLRAYESGLLYGPTVNKITIMNYVTPGVVRAVEWVDALVPRLGHLYLTSSRDEAFDKSIRAIKVHRPGAQVVIGLEGGYVGHTTGAARSLSDPAVHRQGPGYFNGWKRVPHPADVGTDVALAAMRDAIERSGAENVVAMYIEPIQERTGRVVPDAYFAGLDALKRELDVPLAFVETSTACYRSGRGAFASTSLRTTPDLLLWWAGGQIGFVHVSDRYFVPTALTLVSTWDGDELSLVRAHHQLRAARTVDVSTLGDAWGKALEAAASAGLAVRGAGLYRVIDAGPRATAIADGLLAKGFRVRRFPNGCLGVVPPLDLGLDAAISFGNALAEVCR